jgi:hypothetical protein
MEGYKKKIGTLLTDGDWTYGRDPFHVAQRFDNLHVIGLEEPVGSEAAYNEQVSRRYYSSRVEMIAKEGRGQFSYVRTIDEVPLAITRCLTA